MYVQILIQLNFSMNKIHSIETLCTYPNKLSSPVETPDGIYLVAQNGDILKFSEGALTGEFIIIGQPSSLAYSEEQFYISDFAHQSIVARRGPNTAQQLSNEVAEYKGESFLGPHSVIFSQNDELYFTDSGPFGETSLENPQGSVFLYIPHQKKTIALAYRCLAYPTGLALSQNKQLFVCEMAANRLLRFLTDSEQTCSYSTFYQFNGRYGPSCITIKNELIYVGHYEFKELTEKGVISVLNLEGELVEVVSVGGPEISGVSFSTLSPRVMYVTDNTKKPSLLKVTFKGDKSEDREESKNS